MTGKKILFFGIASNSIVYTAIQPSIQTCILLSNLKKLILFSLSFIFLSSFIYSQQSDLPFEHFSVDEGMPTVVNYILQDKIGYLWFATNSGLYKYDGLNFTSFKHEPDDTLSLIDNTLTSLYEDKAGVLWIGTYLGLEKFDRLKNVFTHYVPSPKDTGDNLSNDVLSVCEDKYGVLWVGTTDGLFTFDRTKAKFSCLRYDSTDTGSISHNSINAIYEDRDGSLWFGTQAGLDKFDFETRKFKHYWIDPENRYKPWFASSEYIINTIFEDEAGIIWLGTNKGLVEFNKTANTFTNYLYTSIDTEESNFITSVCQDVTTGSFWITSGERRRKRSDVGLFLFDRKSKKFSQYISEGNCVLSEQSGTLWIGTDVGIKKLNRTKLPFKKHPMDNAVYSVKNGTEGKLWIYTNIGWKKFDIKREEFIPYSFGKDSVVFVYNSGGDILLYSDKCIVSSIDSLETKITWGYLPLEVAKSMNHSWKTKKGYWFGTNKGDLLFFEFKNKLMSEIKNLKLSITYVYEDSYGLIWIATLMGRIYCFNHSKDTLVELISDIKNPLILNATQTNAIYRDKKDQVWFATNNGLFRLIPSDKTSFDEKSKLVHYNYKNGLLSNNVRSILEDDHGNIWITTTKGISKFSAEGKSLPAGSHGASDGNSETNHFKNYDVSYGLVLTSDIFFGRMCKTNNGEIYSSGARGFTCFHPDSIKDNPFIPPVVITSFKKFDKPFYLSSEIRLPYDENFLSFEFAALSFISPERNQYAYKMEGLDKDWVYSGTRRFASYPNLDPGEYLFRVKGSNNDGIWNEAGTSILIIISPPWWKTWWAYSAYAALFIFLLYGLRRYDLNRISLKNQVEMDQAVFKEREEIDKMKSRFFANISHEFRTPLTLILGPVKQIIEILKDDKKSIDNSKLRNELKVVHSNSKRLLGLVNQLLDLSKLESGNMKLQTSPQNIIPLLKALLQSFCSYAERKKITLKFNSEFDEIIVYIDQDKIEKIITNVLSNALKFTPEGGTIEVEVKPVLVSKSAEGLSFRRSEATEKSLGLIKSEISPPTSRGRNDNDILGSTLKDNSFFEISIRDTGIGIPKEKLPKIFDRFYQVDGSHTREQEGTGIGLSLTKELVELHKGKILVESEEGKGTTFTISIPLGREHWKPEEISLTQTLSKGEGFSEEITISEETKTAQPDISLIMETGKPSLLIVEDNSDVRNYIKSNLEKDYRILEAEDGEDGWNKSINLDTRFNCIRCNDAEDGWI
jgi:signal transduction histidine kinase/ligand-binding sensor domain-containing protein